jgi:hypothetical protein
MFSDSFGPVLTRITYRIKRLYSQEQLDDRMFFEYEKGPTIRRDERLERYRRGLRDPESEVNVYLRSVIVEHQRGAAHHVLTEIVYGEREETEEKTVAVKWQHVHEPRIPWVHTWARWVPAGWLDHLKMAWFPTLLLMCFPPKETWTEDTFMGVAARTDILSGTTPYTYVETRKWLRDPFIEDRFGKLDKDRAYFDMALHTERK